jgi:hypothetical protein
VTDDALALAFRTGLPFVGLRDHAHDPELDRVIPPAAARAARVVPLVASDDRVRLAVAEPEPDISALAPYLGDRGVELAIADREELEAILGPPAPTEPAAPEPVDVATADAEAERSEPELTEPQEPRAVGAEHDEAGEAEPSEPDLIESDGPRAVRAEHDEAGEAERSEPKLTEPQEPRAAGAEHDEAGEAEAQGADLMEPDEEMAAEEPAVLVAPGAAVAAEPDEVEGERPSWLEPPRRRRRGLLVLVIVLLVLIVAGAALATYLMVR